MDRSRALVSSRACQAEPGCQHPPCFDMRLEPTADNPRGAARTPVCAHHLGEMARDLAAWARDHGLAHAHVTVFAVERQPVISPGAPPGTPPHGFAFSTITLSP